RTSPNSHERLLRQDWLAVVTEYVLAILHGGPRDQLRGDGGGVLLPVALVDHLDRLGAGLGDVGGQVLPVGDRRPVPGDDAVAGFQAGGRGGAGLILWAAVGLGSRGGHTRSDAGELVAGYRRAEPGQDDREHHGGDDQVHHRAVEPHRQFAGHVQLVERFGAVPGVDLLLDIRSGGGAGVVHD